MKKETTKKLIWCSLGIIAIVGIVLMSTTDTLIGVGLGLAVFGSAPIAFMLGYEIIPKATDRYCLWLYRRWQKRRKT